MICPEFFGCSGKLTFSETRALAHGAGGPLGDYSDVASNWVASIDRIGQCSLEMPVFAQVALTHVLRDLEAAAARYEMVIAKYPGTTLARDSQERLRIIQEKLGI